MRDFVRQDWGEFRALYLGAIRPAISCRKRAVEEADPDLLEHFTTPKVSLSTIDVPFRN